MPVARFQVLLRWAVQKGIAVTPKSNKAEVPNAQKLSQVAVYLLFNARRAD